ncbi:SpoIIE family protein phosphatase [Actinoplanes sp. KI2]|uniref:SpoIIE family protein phosphatase n=1 Tax=Actinoplanes sp. KI2 TaxID=2983315 RepID=UPI0021D58AE5|nr:SpoIIE family protein phosphatase [Actinoplanes sp. KI2]MCU7727961.1 SpoIIE family protein phosphatase [Actinoplanes sp. KI2]
MSDLGFAGGGDVGRDLEAVGWAATPLGSPDGWPQSLRTAVSILLASQFPMWMAWGPELTFFCNAAYRRDTLGDKYPWALGRPAGQVWAEIWGDIGPRIETVLSTGQATWDEGLLLFLERSGYPEETYHTFSYSPLRDDDGELVGMLCVVSEDTDRVIGERRMATLRDLGSDPGSVRSEQQMLAFAGVQLGRNPHDLPFTLTYLFDDGATRLAGATGIPAGHPAADPRVWPGETPALVELTGEPFGDLPAGAWPEPPTQALLVPLAQPGGVPYGFMVVGLNRYRTLDDGYRGFIELAARHVAAGIASARGYEAQQRRAEELAELDRAKTAFFANISHEFRTPLTLIMGPVDELRSRWAPADDRVRAELDLIHRNGLRLGKLVNTLLDFSRIEAGRMQARFEPVDLAAATAELASVFRSAVERAGLTFEVRCPALAEPVYLDRGMWEKVVLNLLSNALKFTFTGGVRVAVRAGGDRAVVTVADTGAGIPEAEMPRLFERFHRVETTRSRSNEGSGIGLALVKELVELHGGTITAASTVGAGTTFEIRLPFGSAHLPVDALVSPGGPATVPAAAEAAAEPYVVSGAAEPYVVSGAAEPYVVSGAAEPYVVSGAAEPYVQEALRWTGTEDEAPVADAAKVRVLVADDNADMRDYLTRLLGSAGHHVRTVADGQAALDAARSYRPDLIVSDVMMPGLDGLQLVAALRADPLTASTPVLLLSARAGQEASIEGLEAGADDYLVKPFSSAELLARVRGNVALARLRNHHLRWRTALVDSLQEAFFVCDDQGAIIEINSTFTDILGYGPEGLPYQPIHPWWPDRATDPDGYRQVSDAFAMLLKQPRGTYTIPVTHRDGHRLWAAAAFSQVTDPETGRRVIVGTFRDVTADHYVVQRDGALATLSVRLSQAETLAGALRGALTALAELWQATRVYAAIFDGADRPAVIATDPEVSWDGLPEPRRAAIRALRDGAPLTPRAERTGGAGVALEHPSGTLVLWIEPGANRPFTEQDQTLLGLLAGYLGQGLHRVHQNDQQRETALALQRAILGPAQLPPGFAVRYEPATRPLKVGGDWYDTVTLAGGRIGIVVGDCVGHGLQAATVMGQLRSACRALLLQNTDPAQTLTALDRFAAQLPGAMCATVFCGVLDPATGDLAYSSAGHPPAVVSGPDGATTLLDQGRSRPLGVRSVTDRPEAKYTMPARATLLLYTDGLVERRRRPLSAGIDQVTAAVRAGRSAALEDLAGDVMAGMSPPGGFDDDVALLLYRHPGPLEVDFPAASTSLAAVRSSLRGWLARCGIDPETAQNVLVAAGEACANAIEHGHRHGPPGRIRLHAAANAEEIRLTIADSGRWKTPQPDANPHRGRGFLLMRALMTDVTVTTGPGGTVVGLQARIPG